LVILQKSVPGLSEQGLVRFALRARRAVGLRGAVNVMIAGNPQLRALNRTFRGKNQATDVLSFPAALARTSPGKNGFAGDIAISADIAAQNAVRLGHSVAQEIKILMLHGILHLAGYDHERDNGVMAHKEAKLRRELRLPSGLIERVAKGSPTQHRRTV
jgi:probable rRNA maturation factor